MDLLSVPAQPSPRSDRQPAPAGRSGPRIADRSLRAQLAAAVLARPADDELPPEVWQQVALCLERTGHAVACAQDGTDPTAVAGLAGVAVSESCEASSLLRAAQQRQRRGGSLAPTGGTGLRSGRTLARRPRVVPVERTWFRLAGLLVGPGATDPQILAAMLADHRSALADWQRILLAPPRLHGPSADQAAQAPRPGVIIAPSGRALPGTLRGRTAR